MHELSESDSASARRSWILRRRRRLRYSLVVGAAVVGVFMIVQIDPGTVGSGRSVSSEGSWHAIDASLPFEVPLGIVSDGRTAFAIGSGADGRIGAWKMDLDGDRWQSVGNFNLRAYNFPSISLVDHHLVLWGGGSQEGLSAAGEWMNVRSGQLRAMPRSPISPRQNHSSVWSGEELIIWGGNADRGRGRGTVSNGAAFNPSDRSWRLLAPSPLSARFNHTGIWTGRQMLIWGGIENISSETSGAKPRVLTDGASYDPSDDEWRLLPKSPLRGSPGQLTAWTGDEMLVWATGGLAAYSPTANRWRLIGDQSGPDREDAVSVWTGNRLVVWGGSKPGCDDCHTAGGQIWDINNGTLSRVPPSPLKPRAFHQATPIGGGMLVVGGCCQPSGWFRDAAIFFPRPARR